AEPERIKEQIREVVGLDTEGALEISAKSGLGVETVLEALVNSLPPPSGDAALPLKALLVDSWYDSYLGVMILIRVKDGVLKKGVKIRMMASGATYQVEKIGYFAPKPVDVNELGPGEVGFFTAAIKTVADTQVGDTITEDKRPATEALAGFKPSVPVVFCGLFPVDNGQYEDLRDSLSKLHLNDASFHYEMETSAALGLGYRCGFLGLLHLEIIQQRLEREFDLDLITTAPSVVYRIHTNSGEVKELHNPVDMPDPTHIDFIEEPWINATIIVPDEYLGSVLTLCTDRRGEQTELTYVGSRAMLRYRLPLNEVVIDFYDRLKSVSRGYASFDYELDDYVEGNLVKVSILVNGEVVDALSFIVHANHAEKRGRAICDKLKDLIPRQLFKIAVQAAIGGKVIARSTVNAMRKDVTAKCYGGDVSRKRKLLDKQKKGKKKMRQFGNVEIPQSAFLEALKTDD
ncbi:MAG: translation elongation factor 4, partial [Rhodospirillales bacterium]